MLHAVFVGVNHYKDPDIPDLRFARADAERFADLFETRIEPKERRVLRLLDGDATLKQVKTTLGEELPRVVKQGDIAFVYFACHGSREKLSAPDKNSAYLAVHDAEFDAVFATGIEMAHEMTRWMRRLKDARLTVLVLDACFSGYIGGRTFKGPRWPKPTRGDSLVSLKNLDLGEGCMTISAAGEWQLAREEDALGHGLFTYHLLNVLSRPPTDSPTISGAALYAEVAASVKRATGGKQVPVLSGKFAAAELPLLGVREPGDAPN